MQLSIPLEVADGRLVAQLIESILVLIQIGACTGEEDQSQSLRMVNDVLVEGRLRVAPPLTLCGGPAYPSPCLDPLAVRRKMPLAP